MNTSDSGEESSDYLDNPIQATTTIDDEVEQLSKKYLQHGRLKLGNKNSGKKSNQEDSCVDPIKEQDTGYLEFAGSKFSWIFQWFFVNDVAVRSLLLVNSKKPGHMRKLKEKLA